MNFPNKVMQGDFLSEQDKKDLLFGIQNDIDFVAASFVSSKDDMIAYAKEMGYTFKDLSQLG